MRLTDLKIKQLKPPETGQKTHFDKVLPGFGVRVSQGGTKSFVVMYGPKRRLKTIGRYPRLSLSKARREAKRLQAELFDKGGTLSSYEKISYDDARQRFLEDSKTRNKERTYTDYNRLLNRHFSFSKRLAEITRADIMDTVERLSSTPSEQQHAFVAMRVMMNWSVKRGFIDVSPVPSFSFKTPARAHIVSDAELALLLQRSVTVGFPYGTITQLLILTGQRRGEIAALRRS